MFDRLTWFVIAHRRFVIVAAAMVFACAVVVGSSAPDAMKFGGDDDPSSESSRAAAAMERAFARGSPNLVLLVDAPGGVDDPGVTARCLELTSRLAAEPGVAHVVSYWQTRIDLLRSRDGRAALVIATLTGDPSAIRASIERIAPRFTLDEPAITVRIGGGAEIARQFQEQSERDLVTAELIALPVLLVLLVIMFGGVVAAAIPIIIGLFTVAISLLILRGIAEVTDVSVFALNLTTGLSLGLAVDYSLLVVARYREELAAGHQTRDAIERAVATAGRTVAVSAIVVASSLISLAFLPMYYLRSFGYAGVAVVATAAVSAIVLLPALLAVLGRRIDTWTLWRRRPPSDRGMWGAIAALVMRRAIPIAIVATSVLLALGIPFLDVRFGLADERALPAELTSRQVHDAIRTRFASEELSSLVVVATDLDPRPDDVDRYAARLSALRGTARVETVTGTYAAGVRVADPSLVSLRFRGPHAVYLAVVPAVDPLSSDAEALTRDVRTTASPFPVLVGGPPARLVDDKAALSKYAPFVFGWIAATTFLVLLVMTRSVLVPIKALVLGAASLAATFGAMVFIFQQGHFSDLLGFTATGSLETSTPILMLCIAFGLSMDYEVFLLARIREEYLRTGDNEASIATGLQRTGGVITAASATLAAVFLAFATSKISLVKLFGLGLALAIVIDATIIRALLVPAFMRLAGRANWWAPGWLRRGDTKSR